MPKLENAILTLNSAARPYSTRLSPLASLLLTAVYLVAVLTVPLHEPQRLVWLAAYPVIAAEMNGPGFGRVFLKSLWVLPLVVFIGIFNPLLDRTVAFSVGDIAVSRGWVSFISIVLRGLLSMQALLILTRTAGVYGICSALGSTGCLRVLSTQILFTYRYLLVIMEEALGMDRARKARGFGRKSYPLGMWGRMVGQLLIRSYERALRVHRAMMSRGFDGVMPQSREEGPGVRSWIYFGTWTALIILLRTVDFSGIFNRL